MDWIPIAVLIVAGLVMLVVEVYMPGFVVGSIGLVLLIAAAVLSYQTYGLKTALVVATGEGVLALGLVLAALNWFPRTPAGKRMILGETQAGVHSHTTVGSALIGQEGVAHTLLRPTGAAVIDGKRLDVVAESGMIESGSAIKVVAVHENRIIVRKI